MNSKVTHPADQELLNGILHAEPGSIQKLYNDYLPGVIRYIRDNNGSEADARDVFQDAVIVVYKKIRANTLTLEVSLQVYLFAVCKNIWRTQLRYRKSKTMIAVQEQLPDQDADTEAKIEQVQAEQLFYKHFNQLGNKCREILRSFFAKIPMKAIAEKLKTSESYIKKRKHLCKQQLITAIQNDPLYKEHRP